MKILHISKKYPNAMGGDTVVVSNLEKQQKQRKNAVVILTSNCDDIKNGKNIHKFGLKDTPSALDRITPRRLASLAHLFVKSFQVIRKERPDVIHTHSIDMAFAASFAARWYKVPMLHTFHIVTFHDKQQSLIRRKTELLFKKGANPAIITAPDDADIEHFKNAGVTNARLLPNGINLAFWKKKRVKKPKVFTFISVSRFEEQKGLRRLIIAAAILKKQTKKPFKIQLIGGGSLEEEFIVEIASNDVANEVEILGRKTPEEIRDLYSGSSAAVIPSLWESTPITLLEAWAMKLPVVATPVGILQGDKHAKDANIVPIQDTQALADAMQQVLEDNKLSKKLSRRGYKAVQQYTWDKIYKTAANLYKEVIASKKTKPVVAKPAKAPTKPVAKQPLLSQRNGILALAATTIISLLCAPILSGTINTFITLPLAVVVPGLLLRMGVFRSVGAKSLPITLAISTALGLLIMTIESWLMSWLLPFVGVEEPLQTPYVIAAQVATTAVLSAWFWRAYSADLKDKLLNLKLTWQRAAKFAVPLLLPLVAAAGAFRLNNGYGNQLTLIALGLMAGMAIAFLLKPKAFNPIWLLFNIALGLLLSTALRSWFVSGFDVSQEFQVFNMTLQNHHWDINAVPGNAYNSCLSLTTLPTMMQQLIGITPELIFKYFYQVVFALTPVLVFVLARRFADERGAFVSGLFFSAQTQFIEAMPAIVRQELSFLFFALIIYLLIESQKMTRAKAALLGLLSAGMVLSHYSTTYVAIFIFGFTAALLWATRVGFISRRLPKFKPILSATVISVLAALLMVLSFTWYSVVNSSSSNLTNTLKRSWNSIIHFEGISYDKNGQRTRLILGGQREATPPENVGEYRKAANISQDIQPTTVETLPSKNHTASWFADRLRDLLAIIVKILLPVSPFILLALRKTRRQVADLSFLGVGSVITFVAFLFLPSLAQSYNIERVLQQALVILSITGLWAMWVLLPARKLLNTILTCTFVIVYLVLTPGTGLVNQMIGGTVPRMNMNNSGEGYQKYYTQESEVLSAKWVNQHCQDKPVWADRYATLRVTAYSDVPFDSINNDVLKLDKGCLMLDTANFKDNLYYAAYDDGLARYKIPEGSFKNLNTLYTNGSSGVYSK